MENRYVRRVRAWCAEIYKRSTSANVQRKKYIATLSYASQSDYDITDIKHYSTGLSSVTH